MEEKFNESTINRPEGSRFLDANFVVSDLQAHMKQIVQEEAYNTSDRNAITLFKSNGVSVVLIALHNGAEMSTPDPSGNVGVLQVLSGSLNFEIGSDTSTIGQQQLISFHAQAAYHMLATEDVIFLLTFFNK